MEKEELENLLLELKQNKNVAQLKEIFQTTPSFDLAKIIEDVNDIKFSVYILKVADNEYAAEVFANLSTETQEDIIRSFSDKDLQLLLEESFADDIADALDDFPASLVDRVLRNAPKELRKNVNILLNLKENTAGSVMTTEYISLNIDLTAKEALAKIRSDGKKAETVYTIFVRDNQRNLIGTLNLDDLIFAKEDEKLTELINRDFIFCHVNDDQEMVALDFKKYDLNAMAVLNSENKLCGIITIDDVVDVLVEEANEDIGRLNKVSDMETPYLKTPIYKLLLKCLPWILILMVLQAFSTFILSSFQQVLDQVLVLAVFTPLLMDAGGNSGGQTTTIIVRSLAMNEFHRGDLKKVVWKEFRVALCIAGLVATFAFGWIMFESAIGLIKFTPVVISGKEVAWTWGGKTLIAALVASTLFVTMIVSRMVGCLLPFGAKLIKQDPAVLCGPITTTIVDIVTLLTYFILWSYVFMPLLQQLAGI